MIQLFTNESNNRSLIQSIGEKFKYQSINQSMNRNNGSVHLEIKNIKYLRHN